MTSHYPVTIEKETAMDDLTLEQQFALIMDNYLGIQWGE